MNWRKWLLAGAIALFSFNISTFAFAADQPALIPKLDFQAARDTDISFRILNYDDTFTWSATTTAGEIIMDRIGNLSVVNLSVGQKATITVSAAKDGYKTGIAKYNGQLGETTEETIEISKAAASPKPTIAPKKKVSTKKIAKSKTKKPPKKSAKKPVKQSVKK